MSKEKQVKYKKTKILIKEPVRENKIRFDGIGVSLWRKNCFDNPAGYCGGIKVLDNGHLEIKTDGKYRFLNKAQTKKLIKVLSKRLDAIQEEIEK